MPGWEDIGVITFASIGGVIGVGSLFDLVVQMERRFHSPILFHCCPQPRCIKHSMTKNLKMDTTR